MQSRRNALVRMGAAALAAMTSGPLWANAAAKIGERVKPIDKPLWIGFGIGAAANEIPLRFRHISRLPQTMQSGNTPYLWVTQPIGKDLSSKTPDLVEVDASKNASRGATQLAAVLDYENVVAFPQIGPRGQTENFFFMRVAGQGVVLGMDDSGWRLLSSYPFYIKRTGTFGAGGIVPAVEKAYPEVLIAPQNSFRSTFVELTGRFNRWRDGYGNLFARVVAVEIRPEAATTFARAGITDRLTKNAIGLGASASLCRGLAIPVVPFSETRALAEFTLRFSDAAAIQKIRLPDGDAIDLRVEVVVISAEFKSWRNEQQGWHDVSRSLVMGVVFKDHNDAVMLKCVCSGQDKDISANEAAVVPERHLERFDLILSGVLDRLFAGMLARDESMLDAIGAQDLGAKSPLSKSPALLAVLAKAEKVR